MKQHISIFGCLAVLSCTVGCFEKTLDDSTTRTSSDYSDKMTSVALVDAAQSGDVTALDQIVQLGADINLQSHHGATPLMLVLQSGDSPQNKKGFEKLLELGADWSLVEVRGRSVVHLAASQQSDSFWLMTLIKYAADIDISNSINNELTTPLNSAIAADATNNVELLISEGADVNKANGNGECPLLFAALRDRWDVALLLLRSGAKFNLPLPNGRSSVKSFILNRPSSLVKAFPDQIKSYQQVITFLEESGNGGSK